MAIFASAIIAIAPPVKAEAAEFVQQNILQVNAASSNSYISGEWHQFSNGSKCYCGYCPTNSYGNHMYIQAAGCGIVSLVSAVYNLGGTIEKDEISSAIKDILDWSVSKKYYNQGTKSEYLFIKSTEMFGEKWGYKVSGRYTDTGTLKNLINHIKSGNGTSVIHVYGHYMVAVGYKYENGVEYLRVFDPAPGVNTYYNSGNRRGITSPEGNWFAVSDLIDDGGTKGNKNTEEQRKENIEISGYYLVESTHKCTNFTGLGVCTDSDCGKTFDWKKNFNSASAGTYTVVKAFTPRTDAPYDAATKANTTIKKGATVRVEGAYTNAFNNTWYKFTYDSGKVGYVLDEYLELSGLNDLSVTCTDFAPAENASLPLGQGCHVWGTVKSNYPLKNVVAELDGSQYTTWTAPNNTTTSFDINPTDINYGLKFGSLSAGKHTVTLIATDIHGRTQTFLVRSFNMVSTSCNHSYSSTYSSNANNHWKVCSKCGSSASVEAHAYSNSCDASCNTCGYTRTITHTYTNDCDFSCDVCGATRSVSHSYKYKYEILDDHSSPIHWQECSSCGDKKNEEAHTFKPILSTSDEPLGNSKGHYMGCQLCDWWERQPHIYDNDCDVSCNVCNYTDSERVPNHSFGTDCSSDESGHWYTCLDCGETDAVSPHIYSNDCDASCNVCGYIRPEESLIHTYGTDYSGDESGHWHTCLDCGERDTGSTHIYIDDCDAACRVCGYIRPEESLIHTYSADHSSDESGHWHICLDCGETDAVSPHIYTNDCDSECNVCDYRREAGHSYGEKYMILSNGHIDVCSVCGHSGILVDHVPGAAATETSPQSCIECGYEICPAIEHIHKYDDGKIKKHPTCTQKGESILTCIDCGKTLTVEVAAIGHRGTDQCEICGEILATDSDSTTSGNGFEGGENGVIQIGCGSIIAGTSMSIVSMIGICVCILVKKKRQ